MNSVCVCCHWLLADGLAEDARGNAWEVSEPASPQYNFSLLCEAGSIFTSSSTSTGTLGSLLFPSHTLPLSYVALRKTAAGMPYGPSSVLWNLQERISCFLSACSFTSTLCLSHWSMCHDGKQPSTANILLLFYHGLQILKDWMLLSRWCLLKLCSLYPMAILYNFGHSCHSFGVFNKYLHGAYCIPGTIIILSHSQTLTNCSYTPVRDQLPFFLL